MVVLMRIGDICSIQNGERKDRHLNIEGNIPVYGSGMRHLYMTNEFNREGKTCKVNKIKSNRQVMIMNEKYFLNNNAFTIVSNDETTITNEYLWFYLENNQHLLQYVGQAILRIDMDHFLNIQIPVPSIIRQFDISTNIITIQNT
jgi:restriction endonuclease S subunit